MAVSSSTASSLTFSSFANTNLQKTLKTNFTPTNLLSRTWDVSVGSVMLFSDVGAVFSAFRSE